MQRLTKQLTKDEEQEFYKMKKDVQMFDDKVQIQCLQYFLQYRSLSRISYDKVGLAFRCAYFMAQKSQSIYNINGEKTRGYSFSLNRLIKNYKLDDTMMLLKDFSKKVVIEDLQASSDLSAIIKEISFLITFYSKFQRTTQKLQFKQRNNEVSYVKTYTSYAWLLYVKAKNEVLNRSLQTISNTCLLAHVLCTMIIYGWDFIRPLSFLKEDKRINSNSSLKQVKKIVKQKILGIFLIKNVQAYQQVAFSFQKFLNQMINKSIISMNNQKADFLGPHRINNNYQRLDDYYRKSLNPQHLDERIFFKQRTVNYTPSKFTPFARQNHNKKVKPKFGFSNQNKQHQSFKTLNYDVIQKQTQICQNVPVKDIKLPKGIVQSPSMVVVPFVCSTPTTASMEMYNYLTDKSRKLKDLPLQQRQFDKQIFGFIDNVFENQKIDQQQTKKNMIVALYKVSSWEYLHSISGDKETDQLLRAFLSLCIQLVFYTSNVSLSFDDIQQHIQGQPLQLWKAIDHFHRVDKRIPTNLKYHLLDLQTQLISQKIWSKYSIVSMIVSIANNSFSGDENNYIFIDKLFRRVLHHIGFRIKQVTDLLYVDEQVSEKIFETMKETLISHEQLLHLRHIDQLILCAIFSNCKIAGYDTKFNNIKQVYEESNPNLKSSIENIIFKVYINEKEKTLDIIKFYNLIYLQTQNLKKFIHNLYDGMPVANSKKNALLMSPLKTIIPKDINFRQKPKVLRKGNVTPQPQLLYAYNESPILKYQMNAFKGKNNLKSKRVLDFDLQETVTKPKPQQMRTPTHTIQTQQVQVTQFLSKKIKKGGQKQNGNVKTPPSSHTPISSHRSSHVDTIGNQKVQINGFKIKTFKR